MEVGLFYFLPAYISMRGLSDLARVLITVTTNVAATRVSACGGAL